MPSIGQLLRGTDREFFDLFARAATNNVRAAELMHDMLAGFPESQILARDIVICKQQGSQLTQDLTRRVRQSAVTPIDRADILRLSSALDEIVDCIEEAADYLVLYGVEAPMMQAEAQADVLLDATRQIDAAIPRVRDLESIREQTVEVRRLENEGDRIVRDAIASLFEAGIDPLVVIRWKDIFERLEDAIDATGRAAFILEGIVIKNA